MKKINYANLIFAWMFLTACSPINSVHPFDKEQAELLRKQHLVKNPGQQMISLALPNKQAWKKFDVSALKNGVSMILVPHNENAYDWRESIQTQSTAYATIPDATAQKIASNDIDNAEQYCREAHMNVIAQTPQYMMYRLTRSGCSEMPDLVKVIKIFNGVDAVYAVGYLTYASSQSRLQLMSDVIQSAQLVVNPETIQEG